MFKCEKCGREFVRESNKSMHEKFCKGGKGNKENSSIIKDKNNKKSDCVHDFIMLNPKYENQRQALSMGYSAFCRKCKDLI